MRGLVPAWLRIVVFAVAGLILAFLVFPVLFVIPMSFSGTRYLDFPPATWSTRWYERLVSSSQWSTSLIRSLQLAFATTVVATPLGVAVAYGLHHSTWRPLQALRTVLILPLLTPHITIALGTFYLLVRTQQLGSFAGLVAAHAMLALPFVVITVGAGLRGTDPALERAAMSLGCGRFTAFRRVTAPLIAGSIVTGALFAFVTSLDEVVVALFISAGTNTTVTKVMFSSLRDELDPTIAAVSSVLIAIGLFVGAASALAPRIRRAFGSRREARDLTTRQTDALHGPGRP